MPDDIFIIQNDGNLLEMSEQTYDSEALLQELLAKYPKLLAGGQMDSESPRRWLLVKREMGIPGKQEGADRWSVDHLFLDQDGIPTLVEVKRSSDTRLRREVVGQMLDYAANAVVYWPVEQMRAEFEANSADAQEELSQLLDEDADPEEFWQKVKTNLQAGKIRMLFVADLIPTELRRIVEFLNEQMDPAEVLAVEIKQFVGEGMKTLVPRVIGTGRKPPPVPPSREWDEVIFLADLEARRGSEETMAAKRILEWSKERQLDISWGTGQKGSFTPILMHDEKPHYLMSVWTHGKIEVLFQRIKNRVPFDAEAKRRELQQRLNEIPGVTIPDDKIGLRPGVLLDALKGDEATKCFLNVMDWVIEEIKAT